MDKYTKIIEIAKVMELTPADLKRAYDFWIAAERSTQSTQKQASGIVSHGANTEDISNLSAEGNGDKRNSAPVSPPSYKVDDITAAIARNKDLDTLYKHAQTFLGKTLSATEVQILYSLYDYYGFPVEVAMEMLTYAAKTDKRNMRYIEKIAIDWAEKGILTFDDATAYIGKMRRLAKREAKIKQMLGIDRKLTQTEEQFIGSWANELKVPLELVPIAYERMINGTGGKFSCPYMDKIFKNWLSAGIKTAAQVEAVDAEYKSKQLNSNGGTVKPSKFNNFAVTSGVDYAAAAQLKINKSG